MHVVVIFSYQEELSWMAEQNDGNLDVWARSLLYKLAEKSFIADKAACYPLVIFAQYR